MKKPCLTAITVGIGMLILILDAKTALLGAADGINLCLQTVIPALFPFFLLSNLLTSALYGKSLTFLAPLCRSIGIPKGAESILAAGFLGGYPVGAQCTAQAVREGRLSKDDGRRMLAFCSIAGPAFIFGIGSRIFTKAWMRWALWAIQIISALLTGLLIPGKAGEASQGPRQEILSFPAAMQQSTKNMAMVSGWVVIFRVILAFCDRWFLWLLPPWAQCVLRGILELTNGCCSLTQIVNEDVRFMLFSLLLSFGGLCVTMQTFSVCQNLDSSMYLPGKLLQAAISTLLAGVVISQEIGNWLCCLFLLSSLCGGYYYFPRKGQKNLAFRRKPVYNKKNLHTR